jgi:hypothetical protein
MTGVDATKTPGDDHVGVFYIGRGDRFDDDRRRVRPKDSLKILSPAGTTSDTNDIAKAVVYLTEGHHVTGEVLPMDSGAHLGK